MNAKELIEQGDRLFSSRGALVSLWQEQAENFYPERADFTITRALGDEFASNLETSYPILARRDLGNAIGTMLRPRGMEWFAARTLRPEREDNDGRRWLQWASGVQRRAMYDRRAQFVRATKEGDHDWSAFGQCVISAELNRARDGLLYRDWHLRDVAWKENSEGAIDTVHRRWKPDVRQLKQSFGSKVSTVVNNKASDKQAETVNCRHIIMPSEDYDHPVGAKPSRHKYISIYLDVDNKHIMETRSERRLTYIIPRWQTVSGSQYAYSPATVAALPEARLIQSMTATLLEAGEKRVDPPMLATEEAVNGNVNLYAGGVTWVDKKYDERLGEVLRPLSQDSSGFPFGFELRDDVRNIISEAFYLSKISMPLKSNEMTAYEVEQRVREFIRQAGPLFEPMEDEYNGQVCEETFAILADNGAFGSLADMPPSLRGAEYNFQFQSPLRDAYEREKSQRFLEGKQLLAQAIEMDPSAMYIMDGATALRDALNGINVPARWLRGEKEVAEMAKADQEKAAVAEALQAMGAAGDATESMGRGAEAMAKSRVAA